MSWCSHRRQYRSFVDIFLLLLLTWLSYCQGKDDDDGPSSIDDDYEFNISEALAWRQRSSEHDSYLAIDGTASSTSGYLSRGTIQWLLEGDDNDEDSKAAKNQTLTASTEDDHDVGPEDSSRSSQGRADWPKPNLLFLMTDQQRFDALEFVQERMKQYRGKLRVRTPNLNRLAESGVWFRNAYCQTPICSPARSTLRTGCTVERTGIQDNEIQRFFVYNRFPPIARKINEMHTFDQILVEDMGYTAEYYGKFHIPQILQFGFNRQDIPVYTSNSFNYDFDLPQMVFQSWKRIYQKRLFQLLERDGLRDRIFKRGQQRNQFSTYPYDPIGLDPRFGKPANSNTRDATEGYGTDTLSANYSSTALLADMVIRAIERLGTATRNFTDPKTNESSVVPVPWTVTASFNAPHPPMVVPNEFYGYYKGKKRAIATPLNIGDRFEGSAYAHESNRKEGFANKFRVRQLTAVYYGLVEEIDSWIGQILDKLDEVDATDRTMIVFTSDHGEMLGAHNMKGKNTLLEESVRIPLLMSFPGRIPPRTVVDQPVSHLDVYSTVLDYMGAPPRLDKSDGKSLRRHIERTSTNGIYDERIVVAEINGAFSPFTNINQKTTRTQLQDLLERRKPSLGKQPNFMIRKRRYKLLISRKADNKRTKDMLLDLAEDPYELTNQFTRAGPALIGKAEHLKALLIEWMKRNDGPKDLYSDPKWNNDVGAGDILEIRKRRTWKALDLWFGDRQLLFAPPVARSSVYIQNEYLYIGRATKGRVRITRIAVRGRDARDFRITKRSGSIEGGNHLRIKVAFQSRTRSSFFGVKAYIEIFHELSKRPTKIPIKAETKREMGILDI